MKIIKMKPKKPTFPKQGTIKRYPYETHNTLSLTMTLRKTLKKWVLVSKFGKQVEIYEEMKPSCSGAEREMDQQLPQSWIGLENVKRGRLDT